MPRAETRVVSYVALCHGLIHVLELTYAAILVAVAREFGQGYFVLGMVATLSAFAFGLGALPSGFLADAIGERRLLLYCFLGAGVASLAVGLSPNLQMMGIALTLLGLALGLYHPAGASLIARVASQRGTAFGYLGIGGNLGLALGPMLAATIASLWGWRAAYLIFAVPCFLLAALIYSLPETKRVKEPQLALQPDPPRVPLRSVFVFLLLIYAVSVLNGFIYRGAMTFLPAYLSERVQFTLLQVDSMALAGSFATLALLFGVGGQFLGGYLSQRRRREGLAVMVAVLSLPVLLVMGNTWGTSLVAASAVFAFFHFMGQPIYNNLIADHTPPAWQGRSYGISFFCAFGLGSFSGSLSGFVAERLGIHWVFLTLAGFALVVLVCALLLLLSTSRKASPVPSASPARN